MKFTTEQLEGANKIATIAATEHAVEGACTHVFIAAAANHLLAGMITELATTNRSLESALKERDGLKQRLNRHENMALNPWDNPNSNGPTPSRYQFEFQGVHFDVYRLLEILGITHHAQAHAFKKVIRAGRGHKSVKQDIKEAKQALTRWSEMLDEDSGGVDKAPDAK